MDELDGLLMGGSIDNFIPTIWSARILVALEKAHLLFAEHHGGVVTALSLQAHQALVARLQIMA